MGGQLSKDSLVYPHNGAADTGDTRPYSVPISRQKRLPVPCMNGPTKCQTVTQGTNN